MGKFGCIFLSLLIFKIFVYTSVFLKPEKIPYETMLYNPITVVSTCFIYL